MPKTIDEMWAWLAVDPRDDTEGVMGFRAPTGQWMPMVGADADRAESLRPIVLEILRLAGGEARLVRFTTRTDVETVTQ